MLLTVALIAIHRPPAHHPFVDGSNGWLESVRWNVQPRSKWILRTLLILITKLAESLGTKTPQATACHSPVSKQWARFTFRQEHKFRTPFHGSQNRVLSGQ